MKRIKIIIYVVDDDAPASATTATEATESDQAYWQDEQDDMMDDYD